MESAGSPSQDSAGSCGCSDRNAWFRYDKSTWLRVHDFSWPALIISTLITGTHSPLALVKDNTSAQRVACASPSSTRTVLRCDQPFQIIRVTSYNSSTNKSSRYIPETLFFNHEETSRLPACAA